MKIIYSDIQAENYDPNRHPSFGYSNFYLTLKHMPGVEVIEYPYDQIVDIGREKFNAQLLALVKKEKPDLFFAFPFTDEFESAVLDEVKTLTKSVAWFADDTWRIFNYSRNWAPHFTFAVTTWSQAPVIYHEYGITNVIRSQWACNERFWKPIDMKKTIDVSFIGQRTGARANLVNELRAAGIPVLVRGWGWPDGRVTPDEMLRIISSSKINLNINDPPSLFSPKSLGRLILRRSINRFVLSPDLVNNFQAWKHLAVPQIKARPFELAGCGAFVISGLADDMDRYYRESEEMVFYKREDDLIQKIKYYLKSEKEREGIAHAALVRTLAEHTYEKRFKEIFKNLGLHK